MTWDNGYKAFFKLHRLVIDKKFGSIPYARKIRNWIYSKSSSSGTPVMVDLPRHRLFVNPADKGVGRNILFNGAYEPTETQLFELVLRPGMRFVDVGAHVGYYTTLGAKLVGSEGEVVAIEPAPANNALLRKNIEVNNLTQRSRT